MSVAGRLSWAHRLSWADRVLLGRTSWPGDRGVRNRVEESPDSLGQGGG